MTRVACTAAPWPTPSDLVNAPELATLAVIEGALGLLGRVLVCAHPELLRTDPFDDHAYPRLPADALIADQLLIHADRMMKAISEYRAATSHAAIVPDDDFPF